MAENNALPYQETNSSGVGNYIFQAGADPLSVHLKNLERVDNAIKQRKDEQKQKMAHIATIAKEITPDFNGIYPDDAKYLQEKADKLHEHFADYIMNGADPSSAPKDFADLNKGLAETKIAAAASQGKFKMIQAYSAALQKDQDSKNAWDKEYAAKGIAKLRLTPPDQVGGVDWESEIFKENTPALDDMLSKHVAMNFKDYQQPTTTDVEISKGAYGQQIHKTNITPSQVDAMANSYLYGGFQNSKEAVDKAFSEQPVTVVEKYVNAAKAGGISNDITAAEEGKKQWLKDHIAATYVKEQNSYKFDGITPQERAKWKISESQSKEIAKGGWVWTMTKGAIDPNSDVSTPQPYTTVNGVSINLKGNPALNAIPPQNVSVPVYELDANGKIKKDDAGRPIQARGQNNEALFKTIPNHVLANGYDANGDFILVTSESKYYGDATGDTKQELQVIQPDQAFDYIKSRVAGAKYAQGATDLANAEGYRNAKTGKVTFQNNPNIKKDVQQPIQNKTIEHSPKAVDAPKKEIKEADVPAKAKAAGYTEKEYREMLKNKGVTITK